MQTNNTLTIWVVKDNEGKLRPLAGVWKDEASAREYESKNKLGDVVVQCLLTEIQ